MQKKILIIEDNSFMQVLLQLLFKKEHSTIVCSNGEEAFKWMQDNGAPDLIICDLKMPFMDGFMLLEKIKTNLLLQQAPVIVLSGIEKSQDRIRCLQLGADDFMTKPFNPTELKLRSVKLLKTA